MEENNKTEKVEVVKTEKPYYDVKLRIVLFHNEKREGKTDPDYSGIIEYEKDKICQLVFWRYQGKMNIFLNGFMQKFTDEQTPEFRTTLKITKARNVEKPKPCIEGTIILNDGWEYNVVLWNNPALEDKKQYFDGIISMEEVTNKNIEEGVI